QALPGLENVLFKDIAVVPALLGRPLVKSGIDTLIIQHWPGQDLTHVPADSKQQYASSSGQCPAIPFDDKIPMQQEPNRVGDPDMLGVTPGKLSLIPMNRCLIKALVHRNIIKGNAVVTILSRIAQKALQLT